MLLAKGIVLEHHIYVEGMTIDPAKIEVIVNLFDPSSMRI